MNKQMNPTRIVALCLGAFALVGVLAVGFAGDDEPDADAAVETGEYAGPILMESPDEGESSDVVSETDRGSPPDYDSWVDEPEEERASSDESMEASDATSDATEEKSDDNTEVPQEAGAQ